MILLHSPLHQALIDALVEAVATGRCSQWDSLLYNNPVADGFLAVMDYGFSNNLFATAGPFREFGDWLLNVEQWRQNYILDPTATGDVVALILYHLWERFSFSLGQLLRQARLDASIPQFGGVLAFVGGISRCLVLHYELISGTPRLRVVAQIEEPKSAFDFWGATEHTDIVARNELKNILSTGHKLVAHRGVLVHVDKRSDTGVFGPSIDTLILSEILAQQLFEPGQYKCQVALEVGCGNGLLTAAIAEHSKDLRELFAVDISFPAISCTRRNMFNLAFAPRSQHLSTYYIAGPFLPDLLNRRFDLVVCNPPYIPIPSAQEVKSGQGLDHYYYAVAGTSLAKSVLTSAPKLLSPGGRLLLMASSLSLRDTLSWVPDICNIARPLGDAGFEVLFNVEAVLNRPEWLSFLQKQGGLFYRNNSYYHTLHPIWVEFPAK